MKLSLPLPLALFPIVLAALAYRVFYAGRHYHKGDAIVIAQMAGDIAQGISFPVTFYGQPYMGSIEAWITAPLYLFFGPAWWMISFAPVLVSTLGVIAFYLFGASLGGRAAGLLSAALWAFPPFAVNFYNITPRGCYPEVICGGTALLWIAARGWKGASIGRAENFFAGLLMGVLFWTSLLSIPAIAASAFFIFLSARSRGGRLPALAGFLIGAAPFAAMIGSVTAASTGGISLDNFGDRPAALFNTFRSIFIPGADLSPPAPLVWMSWFSLSLTVASLAAAVFHSVVTRRMVPTRGKNPAAPLIVFAAVFLAMYLLNDRSASQQTRYLLPLVIALYPAAGLAFSWIYPRSRTISLALAGAVIAPAMWGNHIAFEDAWRGESALKRLHAEVVKDAARKGVKSLVWGDHYDDSYRLTYEAMVQGADLLAIPWMGSRSYWINNAVEKDPHVAVYTPLPVEALAAGFGNCCGAGYDKIELGGVSIVRDISAARWPAVSIPPDEWVVPENLKPLGDRRFSTTYHSNESFTIGLSTPRVITRIRAIYGRRWPETTAIFVSMDGAAWREISPPSPQSFFVPQGPKVYLRTIHEFEREFQEWNFRPIEARFIRFGIKHPEGAEYDIHELFIYALADDAGHDGPVLLKDEDHPPPSDVLRAAREHGVSLLAANRWHAAGLYDIGGRDFTIVTPAFHGYKNNAVGDAWLKSPGPGLAALVENSDAGELAGRLENTGAPFAAEPLGAYTLVTLKGKTEDLWWTGFTLINY